MVSVLALSEVGSAQTKDYKSGTVVFVASPLSMQH